jgi:MFS family permease
MRQYRSPSALWARFKRQVDLTTTGGSWSVGLEEGIRYNLRWFFMDGTFASASDAISVTYLSLYVLALGANSVQIGLMTALASLSAALLLLPGAMLSERIRKRKLIVVIAGGGINRLTLLLMALTPLVCHGPLAVTVAIGLKVLADGCNNFGVPAWTSLTADMVSLKWRGRYFGTRNIFMGISNMASTLLVGLLITQMAQPVGYQVALGLAFAIGACSTFSFAHLKEPPMPVPAPAGPAKKNTPTALWQTLKKNPIFLAFCAQALVWNLGLSVAGSFFNVYLVQDLKATAAMVGVTSIVSSITSLPGQRLFGHLADRWGPRKIMIVTGFLIPLLPFSWAITTAAWQPVLINTFSGFVWAGYNIAAFNFLLVLTPSDQRERFTALYQIVIMVANTVGAATGGLLVNQFGFRTVFIISGITRTIAMIIFVYFIRQPQDIQTGETNAA